MRIGSCANKHCEPRQVRKEAAVSSKFIVPQGYLVWANCRRNAHRRKSKVWCTANNF